MNHDIVKTDIVQHEGTNRTMVTFHGHDINADAERGLEARVLMANPPENFVSPEHLVFSESLNPDFNIAENAYGNAEKVFFTTPKIVRNGHKVWSVETHVHYFMDCSSDDVMGFLATFPADEVATEFPDLYKNDRMAFDILVFRKIEEWREWHMETAEYEFNTLMHAHLVQLSKTLR